MFGLENIPLPEYYAYNLWYEKNYPNLTSYGLWLKGGEINTLAQEEYQLRPERILFVRLSTYFAVAESFTHQILYQIAANIAGIYPDLAYLPPINDIKLFAKDNIPWLLGTQTKLGPQGFSLIAFSNSIVQEILNIPHFLKTSGIPLSRNQRIKREDIPLIILGGANALYTTGIWGVDSWLDGVFVGTDTKEITKLLTLWQEARRSKKTKEETLAILTKVNGFYLTDSFPKALSLSQEKIRDQQPVLTKAIVSYNSQEIGAGYLEISQGCRGFCSFCAESWGRKPYQEEEEKILVKAAKELKAAMGLEKINLFSFNFNMYSQIYQLLNDLVSLFKNIGLKSQRFDQLALYPDLLAYQESLGKEIYSFGLEGISSRLRRYLNKNLADSLLYKSLVLPFAIQAQELKIFILSTGLEEDSDLTEFRQLLNHLKANQDKLSARTKVLFSLTPLVRFPVTPLEFSKIYWPKEYEPIISSIRDLIQSYGFEFRQAMDANEYWFSQILLKVTNPKLKQALADSLVKTNFIYYRNFSQDFLGVFFSKLKELGINLPEQLTGYSYEESLSKPWANIAGPVSRQYLWQVYQANSNFKEIGPDFSKIKIVKSKISLSQFKAKISQVKAREGLKSFYVDLSPLSRGLPRKYLGLALARALMQADNKLTEYFRFFHDSYVVNNWCNKDRSLNDLRLKPVYIYGYDIFSLVWLKEAIPLLDKQLNQESFFNLVNLKFSPWGKLIASEVSNNSEVKIKFTSPYEFSSRDYFKKRGLSHQLTKLDRDCYRLDFTKSAIKENIIKDLSFFRSPTNKDQLISLSLSPSKKFNIEDFVKESFVYPSKNDWLRVMVRVSF